MEALTRPGIPLAGVGRGDEALLHIDRARATATACAHTPGLLFQPKRDRAVAIRARGTFFTIMPERRDAKAVWSVVGSLRARTGPARGAPAGADPREATPGAAHEEPS